MTRRAQVAALLATLCGLALPAPAVAGALDIPAAAPPQFRALLRAKLHMPPPRNGFESRFDLQAQHGYVVTVVGEGDIVAVEVSRPAHPRKGRGLKKPRSLKQAVTAYVARGTVTPRRITASFGQFGSVDVRFQPSGRVVQSQPRRRCRGTDHYTSELGVFVGGVRFSGEKRYVAVRSHRAKGRIRTPLHLHCSSPPRGFAASSRARQVPGRRPFNFSFLSATWRHAVSAVELITFRIGDTTLFGAINEESLGSMARVRYALATASSKDAFAINDSLTEATISPPEPFRGKGRYSAAPDGTTTWTGPLSVSFPGAPRLALTGEAFEATLDSGF
jgi:hypothetical protein